MAEIKNGYDEDEINEWHNQSPEDINPWRGEEAQVVAGPNKMSASTQKTETQVSTGSIQIDHSRMGEGDSRHDADWEDWHNQAPEDH